MSCTGLSLRFSGLEPRPPLPLVIEQLHAALACLGHGTDHIQSAPDEIWPDPPSLVGVAAGADADLLLAGIEAGCHVFLTRDKAMIRKAGVLSSSWYLVTSPVGLIDRLAETGELAMATTGRLLLPDSHKWLHATAACEATEA